MNGKLKYLQEGTVLSELYERGENIVACFDLKGSSLPLTLDG